MSCEVGFLCLLFLCAFYFGRSVEFALGNYSPPSASLICRNQIAHHLVLYYLVVSCALFRLFWTSRQYVLYVFAGLHISAFSHYRWPSTLRQMIFASVWHACGRIIPPKVRQLPMRGWTWVWTSTFYVKIGNGPCEGWHEYGRKLPTYV